MFSDKNIISVTDKAAERVKYLINKGDENVKGLRIGVKSSGCSGFKYNFSFDDKVNKNDNIFNKAIIDINSLKIISGSVVDFKKELIGNSFVINNPQASSSCGCGLSFSV